MPDSMRRSMPVMVQMMSDLQPEIERITDELVQMSR
jgi:hypothetical protein